MKIPKDLFDIIVEEMSKDMMLEIECKETKQYGKYLEHLSQKYNKTIEETNNIFLDYYQKYRKDLNKKFAKEMAMFSTHEEYIIEKHGWKKIYKEK